MTGIPYQPEESVVRMLARRFEAEGRYGIPVAFESYEAAYGYEVASRLWRRATDSFDWRHSPEEFADGMPAGAVIY